MKITFDVSGSDPEKATQDLEPPKPGVYVCKIDEINPGYTKDEDTGKPDKSRPRLEVIYRVARGKYKGAPLWDYISFSEASQWKYDQFLQALGIASTKKRKGSFESSKQIGKLVKVRVQGQGSGDEYRARPRGVFKYDPDAEEDEENEDVEDEEVDDEDEEDEETETEDDEDDDTEDEDEDGDDEEEEDALIAVGRTADSGKKGAKAAEKQLRASAKDAGLDPDEYDTWEELAEALVSGGDSDDEDDEEEEEDDGYDEMDLKALKAELKSRKLKTTGDKEALVARLRKSDASEDPF